MGHISTSKKIILSVLGILLILSLLVGVSYAYYIVSVSQTNKNVVKSSCLNLSISNEENVIKLEKQIPIMNEEGKNLTPYTFTVNNTCNSMMAYSLNLEELEGSTLSSKYIMTMVNDRDYINMASLGSIDNYYANSVESRVLATGSLGPNASINYSLRLWMDEATPLTTDAMNKSFRSKVVVVATPTKTVDFDYTGTEQTFIAPVSGTYKVELWGAQGGGNDNGSIGGLGGYVSGNINVNQNEMMFFYIGGVGNINGSNGLKLSNNFINEKFPNAVGGYNGGGDSGNQSIYNGSGGGASDVRLINGKYNDFNSLKSRIIVAAGGGGSSYYTPSNYGQGGIGGGLIGGNGSTIKDPETRYSGGGTQNAIGHYYDESQAAGFGFGGSAINNATPIELVVAGGGGGGYYGGAGGGDWGAGGAGGSSFISGHNGCDAIKEESTENNIIHTGQSVHYSGMYFTDTVMIDGEGYKWTTEKGAYTGMPTHDGAGTMKGNTGNGYARITYIG